jgi:DNA (cytosine-5)-methyltransferase 1
MNVEANKNITDTEDCTNADTVTVEPLVIRHGSLFSGIGGFDLAAQWTGWENVFQVEIDDYCTKVLEKNFPNAKRYRDIREFNGTQYRGTIDVVSGGFPCQPFSTAGKRRGKSDERYLWKEMLRIIQEVEPRWIVAENVRGLLTIGNGVVFEEVLADLEAGGYETQPLIIPAAGKDAPHIRERIWIIGNSKSHASDKIGKVQSGKNTKPRGSNEVDTYTESSKCELSRRTRARGERNRQSLSQRRSQRRPKNNKPITSTERNEHEAPTIFTNHQSPRRRNHRTQRRRSP